MGVNLSFLILQIVVLWLEHLTDVTATSVVHSKIDYCNSVYYRLPESQLSHLHQIQNSLARTVIKLLNPVLSLPSCTLFTGSESRNALNTSSFHLPTKFSQPPNLRIFIITTSSQNSLFICCHYCSATNIVLTKNKLLLFAPFVTLHLVSGINYLCFFVNFIPVPVSLFLTHLFLHL